MSIALGFDQELEDAVPEPTLGRVASTAFDLAAFDRPTEAFMRSQKIDSLNEREENRVEPEIINKHFPGLKADRAMTMEAAQFVHEFNQEKQAKQEIISKASGSFFKGTVVPFAVGAASSAIDPVDLAVGFSVGAGFSMAAKSARIAAITSKPGGKFAQEVVENAIGNTVAEAFVAEEAGQRFEEYTADQFLTNVVGGSIVSASVFRGAGAFAKEMSGGFKTIQKLGPKLSDATYRMTKTMESEGISSRSVLDKFYKPIIDLLKKTDDFDVELNTRFEGKVEGGEDLVDTMRNVGEAFEKGIIEEPEFNKFVKDMKQSGMDERIVNMLDKDKDFELNDREIGEFNKLAESERRSENPQLLKTEKELQSYDGNKKQEDMISVAEQTIKENPDNIEFKNIQKNITTMEKAQDLLREFHACRRG